MPFTVLKLPNTHEPQTEVMGEFATEQAARDFAESQRKKDPEKENEYSIETPPKPADKNTKLWML